MTPNKKRKKKNYIYKRYERITSKLKPKVKFLGIIQSELTNNHAPLSDYSFTK